VLFALLFSCGLGVPLPEDIPLITAGILVGSGKMNLIIAAIVAWCGIIGGDCVLYHIAKKYGMGITRIPFIGSHVTPARIKRAERLFDKYGVLVIGVGRMFAGIRGAMVIAAGVIRYNFVSFVIADGLGAVLSGGLFLALGYFLGNNLDAIQAKVKGFEVHVGIGLAICGVLLVVFLMWRKKRNQAADLAELKREANEAVATETTDHAPPSDPAPLESPREANP
jgi:membrane protein DedA with SNARE-associated domain